MIGKLFVISTPIGNLEDITLRALRVLKEVDFIAAEDTRVTRKILSHYDIHTPVFSCYKFNEKQKADWILKKLKEGKDIGLVTDSGTPLISDSGSFVVSEVLAHNFDVIPIPGPSALSCAIVKSGLYLDSFLFLGFLPHKSSKRKRILEEVKNQQRAVILFESPFRIQKLLCEIIEKVGDIKVIICRELTKLFEERKEGKASELVNHFTQNKPRGEFVVILDFKQLK